MKTMNLLNKFNIKTKEIDLKDQAKEAAKTKSDPPPQQIQQYPPKNSKQKQNQ